ncbi:hypothetical protein GCM10010273_09890 [Streptomyces lavendulocolor]
MPPGAVVEGVPGWNAQLHALTAAPLGGAVDTRPRPQAPLGELPVGPMKLFDDLVPLRQPPGEPLLVRQRGGQAVPFARGFGEHQQRVGVLARTVQPLRPELRLGQRPLHKAGQ